VTGEDFRNTLRAFVHVHIYRQRCRPDPDPAHRARKCVATVQSVQSVLLLVHVLVLYEHTHRRYGFGIVLQWRMGQEAQSHPSFPSPASLVGLTASGFETRVHVCAAARASWRNRTRDNGSPMLRAEAASTPRRPANVVQGSEGVFTPHMTSTNSPPRQHFLSPPRCDIHYSYIQ
jgi:hypothetical protein